MEVGTEFYPLDNLKIGLTIFRIDMEDEISVCLRYSVDGV